MSTWLGSGAAPADGAGEPGQWDWKSATTGSDGDAVIAGVVAGQVWVRIELDRFARRDPAASPQDAIRTSLARGERARLVVAVADR